MKKAKTFNQWTKIRSALRKVWLYSPQRREALKAACSDKNYLCSSCMKLHPKYAVDVDHIKECGTLKTYSDLGLFTQRLFEGSLQILCKPCHLERRKKK